MNALLGDADLGNGAKRTSLVLVGSGTHRRDVHFRFGSAILERSGRNLIRKFCAEWLRWVDSDQSHLRVVGHADSVDTYERNRELSRLRAENVIQAMKDVLGPKLRIPQDQITAQPWGECDAYFHGEQDLPNRMFRRVDVLLDGCCVLTLWGA